MTNVLRTRGEFDDNSFTLYPGEPRTIAFAPSEPSLAFDDFRKAFTGMHFRETYK